MKNKIKYKSNEKKHKTKLYVFLYKACQTIKNTIY